MGLDKPAKVLHLEKVRNFYIKIVNRQRIGVWIMEPTKQKDKEEKRFILFCHGNFSHRASYLEIYQIFREIGFYVITFDYRGFEDSRGKFSEQNAVDDIITVYKWMLNWNKDVIADDSIVLVWGHSLGTSLATKALHNMQVHGDIAKLPDGLILLAPFNCLNDVLETFPTFMWFSKIYTTKLVNFLSRRSYQKEGFVLNTDCILPFVKCPVLMFHAEDDNIINISSAEKLFASVVDAIELNSKSNLRYFKFIVFGKTYGIGHSAIEKYDGLALTIEDFCKIINQPINEKKIIKNIIV